MPCAPWPGMAMPRISAWSSTYSLHCSSFLGLPFRFLSIELVKPKEGTTMETVGRVLMSRATLKASASLYIRIPIPSKVL